MTAFGSFVESGRFIHFKSTFGTRAKFERMSVGIFFSAADIFVMM